jgi:hypothetical protein
MLSAVGSLGAAAQFRQITLGEIGHVNLRININAEWRSRRKSAMENPELQQLSSGSRTFNPDR